MQISQNLLNQVTNIVNQVALQSGLKNLSPPFTVNHVASNNNLASKITFLKNMSIALLIFVFLLVVLTGIFYLRISRDENSLSEDEIKQIVRQKVEEQLETSRTSPRVNQPLRVQWSVEVSNDTGSNNMVRSGELEVTSSSSQENLEICENEVNNTVEKKEMRRKCSLEDELEEENQKEDEYRFAEVSTHVHTKAYSLESNVEGYRHQNESYLIRRGIQGLSSKLVKSRSGKQ